MNNRELSHLWANQSRKSAIGSNFFFEGATLYSYGYHFKVAQLKTLEGGERIALFNPDTYSQSTTRHQSLARAAVHCELYYLPSDRWEHVNTPGELERERAKYEEDRRVAIERADRDRKERQKALRARRKLEKLGVEKQVEEWKAGRVSYIPGVHSIPVKLRVNGDKVETSYSASVPVAMAKRAWPRILKAAATPGPVGAVMLDAPDFAWGDYKGMKLERTDAGDVLVVGCHRIDYSEVRYIADQLQLI